MSKNGRDAKTILGSVGLGIVLMILSGIGACLLNTWLLMGGSIGERNLRAACAVTHFISAGIGAYIAGKKAGQKYGTVCLGAAIVYCGILLSCTILFVDCQYNDVGLGIAMCVLGGIVACLLCMINRKKRYKRK